MSQGRTPDLIARAVVAKGKNGGKDFFQTIGAAWQRDGGEGYSVKLQTLPVGWDGSFTLVVPREAES